MRHWEGVNVELTRLGPDAVSPAAWNLEDAQAYCHVVARSHYENFPLLLGLLPVDLRTPFASIYAWCRWADDLGDEVDGADRSLDLLKWWREELERCYQGCARHPVTVSLSPVVAHYGLDQSLFRHLIEAFEQDQVVTDYETFDQLEAYCRRSANPVGRLVLGLIGVADNRLLSASDAICTGLQLANLWQDVARDHRAGRVYLPAEDRGRFGYEDRHLAAEETNEAFVALMQFEIDRTRSMLASGWGLADDLAGWRIPVVVDLFARGGVGILNRIESIGCRVWEHRPLIRKRDVTRMLLAALCRRGLRRLRRSGAHAWKTQQP